MLTRLQCNEMQCTCKLLYSTQYTTVQQSLLYYGTTVDNCAVELARLHCSLPTLVLCTELAWQVSLEMDISANKRMQLMCSTLYILQHLR